jgi:hypothetical protein
MINSTDLYTSFGFSTQPVSNNTTTIAHTHTPPLDGVRSTQS